MGRNVRRGRERGTMRRHRKWAWTAMTVAGTTALIACSASVDRFKASAPYTCPGQPVRIEWQVTGSATIAIDPPSEGAAQGRVPDEGAMAITPLTRTRVKLYASRFLGGSTSSEIWIDVNAGS